MKKYDPDNIFAKILRGDIPCKKVFENERVLAFHDIHPQAPVHILVVPKAPFCDITDFGGHATASDQAALLAAVATIVRQEGLDDAGYRVIVNCGSNGGQEVPHLHLHILGGRALGRMVQPS